MGCSRKMNERIEKSSIHRHSVKNLGSNAKLAKT